jgi:uncharacterized protein YndB with AHSA1/START domain
MKYKLAAVDADFLEAAKKIFVVEQFIELPIETVWQAFADSANWKHWFPNVIDAGYETLAGDVDETPGPGSIRWSHVGKQHYRETMIHWEESKRWSYRIDECTLPIARAQLELTEFEALEGGTLVRWTLACNPRLLMRLASPFMKKTMSKMLSQALKNLKLYGAERST